MKLENYTINIIMYHYVREIKKGKYPNLNGLEFSIFKKQINYFLKHYNILRVEDFIDIIQKKKNPQKPSILLTFDDGYIDHYRYVYPYLLKKKVYGCFYPPIKILEQKFVLDVNKIHFILERQKNRKQILNELNIYLKKKFDVDINKINLKKLNLYYKRKNITPNRYDDKETAIIKQLLQNYLPEKLRNKSCEYLFSKFVNKDSNKFAKEIYMSLANIKEMNNDNMHIGSHGVNHYCWKFLTKKKQEDEVKKSLMYFKRNKINVQNFSVCYPWGSFNKDTQDILMKYNAKFGLTTDVGNIKNAIKFNRFQLPRYDTNDFLDF